jgi:NifU-like protein
VKFYPPKISERFHAPKAIRKTEETKAAGTGASFVCGAFVRFYLDIDVQTKEIREAKFNSNACGFAIAAADVLAEKIVGRKLNELHGFDRSILANEIERELEKFPDNRKHCIAICMDAIRAAFNDFRSFQIEEFTGEKALICTCFGVSEETIEKVIAENQVEAIEEVTEICNAGGGCGSCQPLIQEILDAMNLERF